MPIVKAPINLRLDYPVIVIVAAAHENRIKIVAQEDRHDPAPFCPASRYIER